ncbi:MAG: HipA domain-containing protein [Micropruina sp.]
MGDRPRAFRPLAVGRSDHRIHREDLAQACGRLPAQSTSRGGPGVCRGLAQASSGEATDPDADRRALADFLIINLVAGAPDGHAKNLSLIRMPGRVGLAPLYDLATGLAYDTDTVERQVALLVSGERIASRIGQRQWTKAARLIGLQPEAMINRVKPAMPFPRAFESALAALPDSVPGVQEVAERAAPALMEHTTRLLERL